MSDGGEGESAWHRRQFNRAVLASGIGGLTALAGCNTTSDPATEGGGSDGEATSEGTNGEIDSDTSGSGDGEAVSNTITQIAQTIPEQSQINPWAADADDDSWFYFQDLVKPVYVPGGDELLTSGHTWDAPWVEGTEEIELHTYLASIEVTPPYEAVVSLDESLTYWDGTPLDAEAWRLHDRLTFLSNGGHLDDAETFNVAVEDQYTVRTWRDKGDAPDQNAKPTNEFILREEAVRTNLPFHPKFTKPWVDRFEDAGSRSKVDSLTKELANENVTYMDAAREGYGSGLYRIESPEDINSRRIVAQLREDHPHAEHASVDTLRLLIGDSERRHTLINQGKIDIGDGIVQQKGGRHNRQILPPYIQEVDRFLDNGGDQFLMNNNNPHLGHMADGVPWVRRALVAAVDWKMVGNNGWGPERSVPLKYDVGMLNSVAEKYFSQEFLEKTYKYPAERDTEVAAEWLRRAGYTKEGNFWTSPDGETLSLSMTIVSDIGDWVGAAQTVKSNLRDFGVDLSLKGVSWDAYGTALEAGNLDYDLAIQWGHNGTSVWNVYWTAGGWGADPLLGGDPDKGTGSTTVDAETAGGEEHDAVDNQGNPLEVELPREVGSLTLDGPTESIDVADLVHSFRQPDITEAELTDNARKLARYYNFYLPDFMFHQYYWGVWGNVRDFRFPPEGHPINRVRSDRVDEAFPVLAGVPQTKTSQEYDQP
jgi:hypothetical protein